MNKTTKPLSECNAAERDRRWREAKARQQHSQKEILITSGMSPGDADRQAARMQEKTTHMARDQVEAK